MSAEPFRDATPADADTILGLMRRYYAEEEYPFAEPAARTAIAELLATPSLGRAWIADADGVPVGYLVVTFGFSMEYGGRDAFVDDLYILPTHRARGLGTAALTLAESVSRAAGVHALHLEVERYKHGAQALYRRLGFVDADRHLMTRRF